MAKMFPKTPKPGTESQAEIQLFEVFRDHLSDDYTVFHGCEIQLPRDRQGVDDYEIDFILGHPKYGLILLEVKGGGIRINGQTGKWQRKSHGRWVDFRSPIDQVKKASYSLFQKLEEYDETKPYDYSTWYAIALPDVDVDHDLSPGIPEEIVLDKRKLHPSRIEATIGRLFHYYDRDDKKRPGTQGIKQLGNAIAPSWFLNSYLGTEFEYEADAIKELTEEQYRILDSIDFRKRALIAGCAGSGKTMLATEMARRFAEQDNDVLMTCYNKKLSEYLNESPMANNILIKHFHSLAYYVLTQAGMQQAWRDAFDEDRTDDEMAHFWSHELPSLMLDAAEKLSDADKFDAIVVDEGQDFLETYWLPIQMLLKDPDEGILYIFYDEAQRIYSEDKFPIDNGPHAKLRKNLRSTKPIGEFIAPYYPEESGFEPAGIDSEQDVMIVDPDNYESVADALNDTLNMLRDEHVSLRDVAILTPASEERSQWQHRQELADGYDLRWKNKIKGSRVRVSTIHSFKGLERPVIILTELHKASRDEESDMLVYIGMSRAKHMLIIIGDKPELPDIDME